MVGTFKSLATTLRIAFRRPFTLEYPTEAPVLAPRFMSYPVLTWDSEVDEPYCTGCLICARICPTDCITVSMKDNPKFQASESKRRKIVEDFELNFADCIVCGLCVEYCNFDAIVMSDHFDASEYSRSNLILGLEELLEEGRQQEAKGRWAPPTVRKSQRRSAAQGAGSAAAAEETKAPAATAPASSDDRVAESRRKAAELRAQRARERGEPPASEPVTAPADATESTTQAVDPRVAESRRKAAELRAQRAREKGEVPPDAEPPSAPSPRAADEEASEKPVDPRVVESRRKAAELRAQRAREKAQQAGDGGDDTDNAPDQGGAS